MTHPATAQEAAKVGDAATSESAKSARAATRGSQATAATKAEAQETELPQINVSDSIGKADDNKGFATVSVASGTRTSTPITSIPRAIGVVPQEVIKTQQVVTIADAVRNVAGVSVFESGGQQQIYIRGYLATGSLTNGFIEPGLVNRPLGAVERLEVLKGPASILVGNQPAGGVLNVILKKPSATPIQSLTLSGGSFGYIEGLADVGGALSKDGNLTFRLNGQVTRSDHGYGGYNGVRKYLIAPAIGAKIGSFDLIAGLEYFHTFSPSSPASAAYPVLTSCTVAATRTACQAANRDIFAAPGNIPALVSGNAANGSTIDSLRGYYEATLKLGTLAGIDVTLRSRGQSANTRTKSSSYTAFAVQITNGVLGAAYNGSAVDLGFENDGIQNDLVAKFATGPIRHTVLAGLDYNRQYRRQSNGQSFTTPFSVVTLDYAYSPLLNFAAPQLTGPYSLFNKTTLHQTGVLLQDQMDIFDRLHVLLSTRFNTFETDSATYRPTTIIRSNATFKKQAYNVGATYDVTDWLTPYVSYSQGFRPSVGGVSRGADGVTGIPLPPEQSNQFEVGTKSLLLDDRLSITLSAFIIDTKNTPLPAPALAGDKMAYSIAGAGQHSKGIEFEAAGAITANWNLLLTGTYQKVRGTVSELGAGSNRNVPVAVPKYTVNLWTTYNLHGGALNGLGFGLGEYVVAETFGANLRNPPYALTKFAVFYSGIKHVNLSGTLENAFDKRYYLPAQTNYYVPIGRPRTFLLTASTSFR